MNTMMDFWKRLSRALLFLMLLVGLGTKVAVAAEMCFEDGMAYATGLAIGSVIGDTVCEGTTATLKAGANQNIPNASSRTWEYRAPGVTAWQTVPLGAGAFFGATASETMTGSTAILTLENVPYSLDGYEFRFQSDGIYSAEPNGTLVVRPVKDLHVVVKIDPNPASDYFTETVALNKTTLKAIVYVGGPLDENGQIPEDAKILTDEELDSYDYTLFDWYQMIPGKPAAGESREVRSPAGSSTPTPPPSSVFVPEGPTNQKTFTIKDLTYKDHDSTRYFVILRNGCFEDSDWPYQSDGTQGTHYDGLHSDTAVLYIYEDLLIEWAEAYMYTEDTLLYGTTMAHLDTMTLPTDVVIGVHLQTPDPEAKHQISSAYYIKCGNVEVNDGIANLVTERRKGVQVEDDEDEEIATRKWYYRMSEDEDWMPFYTDNHDGTLSIQHGDHWYNFDMDDDRHDLALDGVDYSWHGMQFMSVALADSIGRLEDGSTDYRYKDTTPILTLVVSEPLPEDLEILPFEEEGACDKDYNYVFRLSKTHISYHYDWEIKRPGDDDYQVVDTLKNKDMFHYGPAKPEDEGTMIRVTIRNYCGEVTAEVEMHVMTVELKLESDSLCVDGTLELSATVINGGDNPTYQWYVNGEAMPDATEQTFTFNPSELPETVTADENGQYNVQVQVKTDPALAFVNPMACADTMITVHQLPTFTVTANGDKSAEVEASGTATLSVTGQSADSRVAWTPENLVVAPSQTVSETFPLGSGSHWFYATVRDEHGCSATDSVVVIVESGFKLDSAVGVVVVQPALPQFGDPQGGGGQGGGQGGGGYETPDTTLVVIAKDDTLRLIACENSIAFVTLYTSGGNVPLRYDWDGIIPMTSEDLAEFGYGDLELPDSVFALYLDGEITSFEVTITEKGAGQPVKVHGVIEYYVTQHVALEAIPHMRHNRYYENQIIFFTSHPGRFSWYNYYDYNATTDEVLKEQHNDRNLYQTDYVYEEGAERLIYVSVADKHGCRSYDSVALMILPMPNAMICNDPNYPEGCILFPEFEVEIHDSWGRLVKAMDEGLGWDGTRRGKPVEVGTYYYRVKLPTIDGYTYVNGAVTVFTKKK